MLEEYSAAEKLVESGDEWEVKGAEDQAMEVEEGETGRDQEARGQDQGLDPDYQSIAPCLSFYNQSS